MFKKKVLPEIWNIVPNFWETFSQISIFPKFSLHYFMSPRKFPKSPVKILTFPEVFCFSPETALIRVDSPVVKYKYKYNFFLASINSEMWSECAVRETLEETGLKIKNVSFATVVNTIVPEEDYHYITVFMKGEIDVSHSREPENTEPDKCNGKK